LTPESPPSFPDPLYASREGLIALGGDLSTERLLAAYRAGIFPWYDTGQPPLWWSPDPRAVIDRSALHVSRSMLRELEKDVWRVTFDAAFAAVIRECAAGRSGGTWLLPEMIEAYEALHRLGHAHSVEVWERDELCGGLYGVRCGALFAAESMFHRRTNASKLALIASVTALWDGGIELFDVQFLTPHLASLGARELSRARYLTRLAAARERKVDVTALREPGALDRALAVFRRR
jgi:leucyl/phenylalanyl-tRNA--protein transferase